MNDNILNRILIEWNDSNIEDTGIIKTFDIKDKFKPQLVYRITGTEDEFIRIFATGEDWNEYENYKDKVYINGEHIELDEDWEGWTIERYPPGEYKVYIEDLDKLSMLNTTFWECTHLISIVIPDSIVSIGAGTFETTDLIKITIPDSIKKIGVDAFHDCIDLKTVYVNDINKFNNIEFENEYSNPTCYGAKLIELKNEVLK